MPDRIMLLAGVCAGLAIYLAAPALLALLRKHPERRLIYRLTPLTLLSFLLWVVLIAWAWTGKSDDAVISRHVAKLRSNNRLPLVITLLVLVGVAGSLLTVLR